MRHLHRDEEAARHINSAGTAEDPMCRATVTLTLTFDVSFIPDRWEEREQEALIRVQQGVSLPRGHDTAEWSVEVL